MITREQVADLRVGDVVEITDDRWPGVATQGPLGTDSHGCLCLGRLPLRLDDGTLSVTHLAPTDLPHTTLTVISRAPRPLYVNHDREEPAVCDVVRSADAEDDGNPSLWICIPTPKAMEGSGIWVTVTGDGEIARHHRVDLPDRLRLLVDGETGQTWRRLS